MSLFEEIKNSVNKHNINSQVIDSAIVDGINFTDVEGSSDFTIDITCKHLDRIYKRVPVLLPLSGDEFGFFCVPSVGDVVVVIFQHEDNPVVIGYLNKSQKELENPRRSPVLAQGDLLIRHKSNTQILIKEEGSIEISKNNKVDGNPSTFEGLCGFKMASDGSFKLFNKTGHGIEVDASGNVIIRGNSIDHRQAGGEF